MLNQTEIKIMNKSELIDAVAKFTKQKKSSVGEALNAITAAIQTSLTRGNNVQLIGFGVCRRSTC
jgi:DNA-binding protein HU-beta